MFSDVTVKNNAALQSGGGIYAYQSKLVFKERINILKNTAIQNGGGITAIGSSTKLTKNSLSLIENRAERGGGMYLESNSKLYIIKEEAECKTHYACDNKDANTWLKLYFIGNFAHCGGALFVSDVTNSGTCGTPPSRSRAQTTANECFFQVLATYDTSTVPDLFSFFNRLHFTTLISPTTQLL